MASIHPHPRSPFWMAHYFSDGRRTTRSTRVPATEEGREKAQAIATAWERAAVMAGEGRGGREWMLSTLNEIFGYAQLPTGTKEVESWESLSHRWLSAAKNRRKVSSATIYAYERVAASFGSFLGVRAKKDASGITSSDVDRWVERINERLTAGTVRTRLKILRGAFNWATKHGVLSRNPASAVEMPVSDAETRDPFTADDINKILAQARAEADAGEPGADDLLTMTLLGLCTGARIGDCAGMLWASVDLQSRRLAYTPKKKRRHGKPSIIELVDPLLSRLQKLTPSGPFVCPLAAERTVSRNGIAFIKLTKRAGVTGRTASKGRARQFHTKTFHSLRHTLASMLAEAGVDDLVRRRITDHEDKAVAAIYQHVSVEATGRALNQVLAPFAGR